MVTVIDKWYDNISSVMLVSKEQSNNISPLSSITYSYIKSSAMDVFCKIDTKTTMLFNSLLVTLFVRLLSFQAAFASQ